MKPAANPAQMLQFITRPAFLVKDGIITKVNDAAAACHISVGTSISEMIVQGKEDYESFSSGKLYLALNTGRAWISFCGNLQLFCLEDNFTSPELRAFALASQHLRTPLSNAVSGTEMIMQREDLEGTDIKQQLGQINRNLYQLIRAVCNMSDVSQLGVSNISHTKLYNARYVFGEIFEKAAALTGNSGHTLQFKNVKQSVECALDAQLIERAVLNMISNAVKFSPEGSNILAVLRQNGNRLSLTMENSVEDGYSGIYGNAFSRFLREPGIESGQMGIGLGMSIISSAASVHGGTILLNLTKRGIVKITMSIPIRTTIDSTTKSPTPFFDSYTGGIDSYLVELSDVLPNQYYENI